MWRSRIDRKWATCDLSRDRLDCDVIEMGMVEVFMLHAVRQTIAYRNSSGYKAAGSNRQMRNITCDSSGGDRERKRSDFTLHSF